MKYAIVVNDVVIGAAYDSEHEAQRLIDYHTQQNGLVLWPGPGLIELHPDDMAIVPLDEDPSVSEDQN